MQETTSGGENQGKGTRKLLSDEGLKHRAFSATAGWKLHLKPQEQISTSRGSIFVGLRRLEIEFGLPLLHTILQK